MFKSSLHGAGWDEGAVASYDVILERNGFYRLAIAVDHRVAREGAERAWDGVSFECFSGQFEELAEAVWSLVPDAALTNDPPMLPPGLPMIVGSVVSGGVHHYLDHQGWTDSPEVHANYRLIYLLVELPSRDMLEAGPCFEGSSRYHAWPPPVPNLEGLDDH